MKVNTLLAKTDHGRTIWEKIVSAYTGFFKDKQAAFRGEKKTYTPADGTMDEPTKRGNTLVVTTVGEKLIYLVDTVAPYIDSTMSLEATNASGTVKTRLVVGDRDFGELSTLELMRLKGLIEEIKPMYEMIPVRSDTEPWETTTSDDYTNRPGIYQIPEMESVNKTTLKETYIVMDPNVVNLKDTTKYTPVTSSKDTIVTLGKGTFQKFTGEWSQRERALLLDRRSKLLEAIIVAIKVCNEAEQVKSNLSATDLFEYLHTTPVAAG